MLHVLWTLSETRCNALLGSLIANYTAISASTHSTDALPSHTSKKMEMSCVSRAKPPTPSTVTIFATPKADKASVGQLHVATLLSSAKLATSCRKLLCLPPSLRSELWKSDSLSKIRGTPGGIHSFGSLQITCDHKYAVSLAEHAQSTDADARFCRMCQRSRKRANALVVFFETD